MTHDDQPTMSHSEHEAHNTLFLKCTQHLVERGEPSGPWLCKWENALNRWNVLPEISYLERERGGIWTQLLPATLAFRTCTVCLHLCCSFCLVLRALCFCSFVYGSVVINLPRDCTSVCQWCARFVLYWPMRASRYIFRNLWSTLINWMAKGVLLFWNGFSYIADWPRTLCSWEWPWTFWFSSAFWVRVYNCAPPCLLYAGLGTGFGFMHAQQILF